MNSIESKIVVIGPPDVGKTCLSIRFVRGRFSENSTTTIGASFLMKTLICGNTSNTMKIWDTAGQEVFRSMSSLYYKDVDGAILVFDASHPETLNELGGWLKDLRLHNIGRQFSLFLACNKIDLNRGIDTSELNRYAASIDARLFLTSSKEGTGVNEIFSEMSNSIIKRRCSVGVTSSVSTNNGYQNGVTINTSDNDSASKKKCCC